ncbi:MAG: hypothetical protein P8188_18155 [Gemmatimonadota bacterium]
MVLLRRVVLSVVAICLILPDSAAGQEPGSHLSRGALLLWGGVSGLGLAVAYINPPGEGWLISDGAAFPVGIVTGLGSALIASVAAGEVEPSIRRRPRLRVAGGTGVGLDLDYSVGVRYPVGPDFEIDAAVLIVSNGWERYETETRCGPFIGCITGTFLTEYAWEQSVTALVRGVRRLGADPNWNPTVSLGVGPGLTHVETEAGTERSTALVLDFGLGMERGRRYRWTAETGARLVPLGSLDQVRLDNPTWYLRLGVAWGG